MEYQAVHGDFVYRTLSRLTTNNLCNCYFFVIKINTPTPKAGCFLYTLLGSDSENEILKLNIFFKEKDLDIIESIKYGDIIRIQRLNLTTLPKQDEEIKNYLGKIDLDHRGVSFCIFSSIAHSDFKPLKSNTKQYSLEEKDKTTLTNMRIQWASTLENHWKHHFQSVKHKSNQSCTSIENLKEQNFVNLIAKVIDKDIFLSSSKRSSLTLWDGTGDDVSYVGKNNDGDTPALGNHIKCNTWNDDLIKKFDEIPLNSWVYLTSAKSVVYNGVLEIKMLNGSKIDLLKDDDERVLLVLKNYKESVKRYANNNDQLVEDEFDIQNDQEEEENEEEKENNEHGIKKRKLNQEEELSNRYKDIKVTETDYPHISITSIKDLLSNQQVPNKYKIHCSMVQHIPLNIQDFTRIVCKNSECGKTSQFRDSIENTENQDDINENGNEELRSCHHCGSQSFDFIFLFKLIVKDNSCDKELPVIFYTHANKFLNLQPSNLYQDLRSLSLIEQRIKFLKEPGVSFDLCIQSYYENDKERIQENVKYQVFGTKLLINQFK